MAKGTLTTKELSYINDLLTCEAIACKKAQVYASTLTDRDSVSQAQKLAKCHETRFQNLLALL